MNVKLQEVAVLIPSLDPDAVLVSYVDSLFGEGFQFIIIVDDGSRKACQSYFEQARELGAIVLHHEENRGKGKALKTGFAHYLSICEEKGLSGIVTADADGQHSVSDTVKVAQALTEEKTLILGTRDFSGKDVPFKSRFGNRFTTFITRLLYGRTIHDTQTGLRGIPTSYVEKCLKLPGDRFEYEMGMLIDAIRRGMHPREVPIETIYENNNRETHFSAVKDSLKIYGLIFRYFFKYTVSSLLSSLIDLCIFSLLTKTVLRGFDPKWAIFAGTLTARIVSSLFNYTCNRKAVFRDSKSVGKSIWRYYMLCGLQMFCSWLLVTTSYYLLRWDTTILKTIVDTLLFFISYQVQHRWVFAKEK